MIAPSASKRAFRLVLCDDNKVRNEVYSSTIALAAERLNFMPGPPDVYYDKSTKRVKGHQVPLDKLQNCGILIGGEGVVGGGETRIFLQIF